MRILVAEDCPAQRTMIAGLLESWGHSVVLAEAGDTALQILLGKNPPRLAILDWNMPGRSGPEICRLLRSQTGPYIYTMLLTAKNRHVDVAEGLTGGADAFVSKPPNPLELQARIYVGERTVSVHDHLRRAQESLEFEATHDALTGLWNRRAILRFLENELKRATRQHSSVSVLMIDVDNFKRINDCLGHAVGDTVLVETAKRTSEVIRPYDFVGRYGGEEFLAILPGADLAGASEVAERIRLQVKGIHLKDSITQSISVSIGVATRSSGQSSNSLIHAADVCLYRAKLMGKDRVESGTGAFFAQEGAHKQTLTNWNSASGNFTS